MTTVIVALAGIGFYVVTASIILWLGDRSGNSGRGTHWKTNPRINSPGELSEHDQAAVAAMTPRDDRRDEQ